MPRMEKKPLHLQHKVGKLSHYDVTETFMIADL